MMQSEVDYLLGRRGQAVDQFHETTVQLMKQLFRDAKIDKTEANLKVVHELIAHLNPLARLPDLHSIMDSKERRLLAILESLPWRPVANRPCLLCQQPTPLHKQKPLSVNDATRVLMAAVLSGFMSVEQAGEAICKPPLKVCKEHIDLIYEMLCKAVGASTAEEVDKVPVVELQRCSDMFQHLRTVRSNWEGKLAARSTMATFKNSLKSFFDTYKPKHFGIAPKQSTVADLLNTILPTTSSAIPGTDRDLLFERIKEKRTTKRSERYGNYPEEMQNLMKPIDERYEHLTAKSRSEMVQIRQKRAREPSNDTGDRPGKTVRSARMPFSQLVRELLVQQNVTFEDEQGPMEETKPVLKEPKYEEYQK